MPNAVVTEPRVERTLNLKEASVGCDFTITGVAGAQCERLRDLGFCESLKVRKLANGRNLICSVCGTRMAISRDLAEQVIVSPV
jgi:Fe2+ transport system protein FeoA